MSTKFFNNTDNPLFNKFSGIAHNMAHFDMFRAVVGYFRSSGYFKLRQEFEQVGKIQILVGINIDPLFKQQSKYIEHRTFNAQEVKEIYTQDFINEVKDCQYDSETETGILQLCQDIISGKVEMRIDNSKNLHAKFYLMLPEEYNENKDGWVIMGSSNISDQGLGTSEPPRYELNVAMKDYDDVNYCNQEFEKLWDAAVPLTMDDVQKAKGKTHLSDQLPTPYEIYMKVLISTFGMQVEDDFSLNLPEGVDDLKYQHDAAIQGYQMLLQHNGFFLADVVGLGKTIIATMIAKRFIEANGRYTKILVVFPPAVRQNWEDTFHLFRIKNSNVQFVSSGSLFKIINEEENYCGREEFDLIIVDEAHNFRHDHTGSFTDLQRICKAPRINKGKVPGRKKVMLLSATPLNNRPKDFLSQVLLFQDSHNTTIEGIRDLNELFAPWTRDYNDLMTQRKNIKSDDKESLADIVAQVDQIYSDMRNRLLSKIMVRRTRTNIMHVESYRNDLDRQGKVFPQMLDPITIEYQMDIKLKMLFYKTLLLLTDVPDEDNPAGKGINYARYRGPEFFTSEVSTARGNIQAKHAARLLMGIYRTHMVKRLESSFFAFKRSLHTLLNVTERMVDMYNQDKVIIVSNVKVAELQEKGMDTDEIIEYITEHFDIDTDSFTYHQSDFTSQFIDKLEDDVAKLTQLCQEWDEVDEDPKLDLFINLLQNELFDDRNLEKKLVVFSESVDTTNYLAEHISSRLGRTDILKVDASNRNQHRNTIRANFDANIPDSEKTNKYNIIITSDVLAEGVNLHRSNIVVNYDSPWNASRLMQRNGRVNRIGSQSEFIYNYLFYPSPEGEEQIKLSKNALIKMQGFQSALGEDSKVYSVDEIVKEFQLFNADVVDDTDRELALLEEARQLYQTNRELYNKIKALPVKSRTIRNAANVPGIQPSSTLVFLTMPRKTQYYLVFNNAVQPITFLEAADKLRANKDELPLKLEDGLPLHFNQVRKAMKAFEESVDVVMDTNVVQVGKSIPNERSEALKVLRNARADAIVDGNTELVSQCEALAEYVNQGTFNAIEDVLRRINRKKLSIVEKQAVIVNAIADLYADFYLDITETNPAEQEAEAFGTVGLVVSETIV